MKIIKIKDFLEKYNLKNRTKNESELQKAFVYHIYPRDSQLIIDTMNGSDLQRVYRYPIYHRDSKIHTDKGFVIIDSASPGGPYWTCFIVKNNKSY